MHIDYLNSCTQESTIIEKANHTYNANDKTKAKHVETNGVYDQLDIEQGNHRQKITLVKLILLG